MLRKLPSRKVLRSLCAEVGPEDGLDPHHAARSGPRRRLNRKAQQLCSQVAEALEYTLADQADAVLRSLHVLSVEPAPDASRLLVTVGSLLPEEPDPARVLEHLDHAAPHLRYEVATAITRRRTPTLVYRFAVPALLAEGDPSEVG